jgi:SAM-dependent methyltransferase
MRRDLRRGGGNNAVRLDCVSAIIGDLTGRRLVEIGCGFGHFLLAARERGAEVIGNDISLEVCEFLREEFGMRALCCPPSDCLKEIAHLDVIAMIDLIEHVPDPLGLLEAAYGALCPGGVLLLWTPNGGAAGEAIDTGRRWVGFRVDLEHFQYLSPRTIGFLSRHQGWIIEHLETLGFPDLEGIKDGPVRRQGHKVVERIRRKFLATLTRKAERDPRTGNYHLFGILRRAN